MTTNPTYHAIAATAYNIVVAVLGEGESHGYENSSVDGIVNRSNHVMHMGDHLKNYIADEIDEDHLAHLITRAVLQLIKERGF